MDQESTDNFRVIWRFLDAVSMVNPYCKFIPGETRLQAIASELKRHGLSSQCTIMQTVSFLTGIIILNLLSRKRLDITAYIEDMTRETTDHIKAAYGVLAMIHRVACCYEYADVAIFKKMKVYFVHAFNTKIRLCSFGLVSDKLYVVNRVQSATLSVHVAKDSKDFKDIFNTMWELKASIEYSHKILEEIKKPHEKNRNAVRQRLHG